MKNKYQRMSKEEKKNLQQNFAKDANNKELLIRLKRVVVTGSLGTIIGVILLIMAIVQKNNIFDYIYASVITVISVIFVIASFKIKGKVLNEYAIKKK